jgi:lipopolysaccharide export system protein LptA
MKSLIAIAATAAAAALAVQPVAAQSLGRNPKAPADVSADQVEIHNTDCVYIYTGSAEALQDASRLRADTMIAHLEMKKGKQPALGTQESGACGDMISLEAKGHVYYVSSDGRRVHGDNGVYDAAASTYTITGDVTAVDGQNVMRGTKMVYNTQTGEGHVEGGGKGPGAKNRPRGVFYPKDSQAQAQTQGDQAPDAAAPAKKKKAAK